MMKQMMTALVIVSALCAAAMAQMPGAGKGEQEKAPILLPGLDKQLIATPAAPCTNFFQYVCGNFSKLYPIPNDRSAYGTGAMIADHTEHILHTMLAKAAAGGAGRPTHR